MSIKNETAIKETEMTVIEDVTAINEDYIIHLPKPFVYENFRIEKVFLDFDSATGDMLEWADAEYLRRSLGGANGVSPLKQNDFAYCALVASKLSGIPYDVLRRMPMRTYNKIISKVSAFLMDLG